VKGLVHLPVTETRFLDHLVTVPTALPRLLANSPGGFNFNSVLTLEHLKLSRQNVHPPHFNYMKVLKLSAVYHCDRKIGKLGANKRGTGHLYKLITYVRSK